MSSEKLLSLLTYWGTGAFYVVNSVASVQEFSLGLALNFLIFLFSIAASCF